MRVVIYPLDDLGQLPNYPSINHAHVLSSHACSLFLSFHLSALPFALKLTHASHLFSQLCPLRAATSLSMVKVSLFFCHPLNLLPLLLQCAFLCIFFINFICLIWSEKYILKVEFWSTKHQATLICYQKPLGTNIDLNFFFLTYHFFFFFFSDLACFVLAKDLFVLLPGTEKVLLRNFLFILWMLCLKLCISDLGILLAWFVGYFRNIKNEKERRMFRVCDILEYWACLVAAWWGAGGVCVLCWCGRTPCSRAHPIRVCVHISRAHPDRVCVLMGLYLFLCFLVLSGSLSFLGWSLWFLLIISYVIFWVLNALV